MPEMHRKVHQNQASVRQASLKGQQDTEMPIPRRTLNWAKDRTRAKPNSSSEFEAWKRHQNINPKEFASQSKTAPVGGHHVPLWHDHRPKDKGQKASWLHPSANERTSSPTHVAAKARRSNSIQCRSWLTLRRHSHNWSQREEFGFSLLSSPFDLF